MDKHRSSLVLSVRLAARLETLCFALILIAFPLILTIVPSAFAQDTVRVRAGEHDDYTRVVFDCKRVNYTATTSGNKLVGNLIPPPPSTTPPTNPIRRKLLLLWLSPQHRLCKLN